MRGPQRYSKIKRRQLSNKKAFQTANYGQDSAGEMMNNKHPNNNPGNSAQDCQITEGDEDLNLDTQSDKNVKRRQSKADMPSHKSNGPASIGKVPQEGSLPPVTGVEQEKQKNAIHESWSVPPEIVIHDQNNQRVRPDDRSKLLRKGHQSQNQGANYIDPPARTYVPSRLNRQQSNTSITNNSTHFIVNKTSNPKNSPPGQFHKDQSPVELIAFNKDEKQNFQSIVPKLPEMAKIQNEKSKKQTQSRKSEIQNNSESTRLPNTSKFRHGHEQAPKKKADQYPLQPESGYSNMPRNVNYSLKNSLSEAYPANGQAFTNKANHGKSKLIKMAGSHHKPMDGSDQDLMIDQPRAKIQATSSLHILAPNQASLSASPSKKSIKQNKQSNMSSGPSKIQSNNDLQEKEKINKHKHNIFQIKMSNSVNNNENSDHQFIQQSRLRSQFSQLSGSVNKTKLNGGPVVIVKKHLKRQAADAGNQRNSSVDAKLTSTSPCSSKKNSSKQISKTNLVEEHKEYKDQKLVNQQINNRLCHSNRTSNPSAMNRNEISEKSLAKKGLLTHNTYISQVDEVASGSDDSRDSKQNIGRSGSKYQKQSSNNTLKIMRNGIHMNSNCDIHDVFNPNPRRKLISISTKYEENRHRQDQLIAASNSGTMMPQRESQLQLLNLKSIKHQQKKNNEPKQQSEVRMSRSVVSPEQIVYSSFQSEPNLNQLNEGHGNQSCYQQTDVNQDFVQQKQNLSKFKQSGIIICKNSKARKSRISEKSTVFNQPELIKQEKHDKNEQIIINSKSLNPNMSASIDNHGKISVVKESPILQMSEDRRNSRNKIFRGEFNEYKDNSHLVSRRNSPFEISVDDDCKYFNRQNPLSKKKSLYSVSQKDQELMGMFGGLTTNEEEDEIDDKSNKKRQDQYARSQNQISLATDQPHAIQSNKETEAIESNRSNCAEAPLDNKEFNDMNDPQHIRIKVNKNKRILEHLTKFSQDIDQFRDNEGMSLLFYDFNGFKSSISHRSNSNNPNQSSIINQSDKFIDNLNTRSSKGRQALRIFSEQLNLSCLAQPDQSAQGQNGEGQRIVRQQTKQTPIKTQVQTSKPPDSQEILRRMSKKNLPHLPTETDYVKMATQNTVLTNQSPLGQIGFRNTVESNQSPLGQIGFAEQNRQNSHFYFSEENAGAAESAEPRKESAAQNSSRGKMQSPYFGSAFNNGHAALRLLNNRMQSNNGANGHNKNAAKRDRENVLDLNKENANFNQVNLSEMVKFSNSNARTTSDNQNEELDEINNAYNNMNSQNLCNSSRNKPAGLNKNQQHSVATVEMNQTNLSFDHKPIYETQQKKWEEGERESPLVKGRVNPTPVLNDDEIFMVANLPFQQNTVQQTQIENASSEHLEQQSFVNQMAQHNQTNQIVFVIDQQALISRTQGQHRIVPLSGRGQVDSGQSSAQRTTQTVSSQMRQVEKYLPPSSSRSSKGAVPQAMPSPQMSQISLQQNQSKFLSGRNSSNILPDRQMHFQDPAGQNEYRQ